LVEYDYRLGILDADGRYHTVYSINTEAYKNAEGYFPCDEGYIYECDAVINDGQYKFFVSNESYVSNDVLYVVMNEKRKNLKSSKEVAQIREDALEAYGITKEMIWSDPLFESSCSETGNPLEVTNNATGRGLGWDW